MRPVIMTTTVQFNSTLLQKYNQSFPRYTSYPCLTELRTDFSDFDIADAIAVSNQQHTALSLYCHLPFCQSVYYFCGYNVIVSGNKNIATPYLDYLTREISQTAKLIDPNCSVTQLHWGEGTPNYFTIDQVEKLWNTIKIHFQIALNAELLIEVNPRYVDQKYITALRQIDFNRISFGVQDFHPQIQVAINRIQLEELLFNLMAWIRLAQFESVNLDLIYGLPDQTLETFIETINKTIQINPDRIAVFSFAYLPWLKPAQENIPAGALPSAQEKLNILKMTIARFIQNGYQFMGMDNFSKSTNELASAQQQGKLQRPFQSDTTQSGIDLIAFGMTGISLLKDTYAQNDYTLSDDYRAIDGGQLPIEKGISLSREDQLRRGIINQLMCNFCLTKADFEIQAHLNFNHYFRQKFRQLRELEADGMVRLMSDRIEVTNLGRLLIRNIASVFDADLLQKTQTYFSEAI